MSRNGASISTVGRSFLALLLLILCYPFLLSAQEADRFEYNSPHMGTTFRIVLYADSETLADSASRAAFDHIEKLNSILSDYDPESELNKLSHTSGKDTAVVVSETLFNVLSRAQEVSGKTGGAFDVTVGPYVQLWRKMYRQDNPEIPSDKVISDLAKRVGFQHMKLDEQDQTVRLTRPGMRLDLGGIAKGYAADEALDVLKSNGIRSALVDAGGDITLGDPPPGNKGWKIEVFRHNTSGSRKPLMLTLSNKAVATSGDLFQYLQIGDTRYSHIIDPRTGLGLTERRQVTVIAPDGITADSYASAASVLEPVEAINVVEEIPGVALFVEQNNQSGIERTKSEVFEKYSRTKSQK